MNCSEWQERIALFTGADLPGDDAAAVEAHLSVCLECRAFEHELSETRALLLSMRTVDEADVATVRSKVLGELQDRARRSVFAWIPFAAAAAVVVLLFGLAMWRKPAELGKPLAALQQPSKEPRVAAASGGAIARVAKRKARVKPQPGPAAEPTVVTLFTDDPDVVIVWIAD